MSVSELLKDPPMIRTHAPIHRRQEIYWAHIDFCGDPKKRPWLIVSNDIMNTGDNVQVVPCSTHTNRIKLPPTTVVLTLNGVINYIRCDQIMTVPRTMLNKFYAKLSDDQMKLIDDALAISHSKNVHPRNEEHYEMDNIRKVMSWAKIKKMPMARKREYLLECSKQFKTAELAKHWGISTSTVSLTKKNLGINKKNLMNQAAALLASSSPQPSPPVGATLNKAPAPAIPVQSQTATSYHSYAPHRSASTPPHRPPAPQRTAEERAAYAKQKVAETVQLTLDALEQKKHSGVAMSFSDECSGKTASDKMTAFSLLIEDHKRYKVEIKIMELNYPVAPELPEWSAGEPITGPITGTISTPVSLLREEDEAE